MNPEVHTLIGAYVLDAVDEDERHMVQAHLDDCISCAAEAAELREAVARLADITVTEPPPELRTRVLAQVRRTRQDAPGTTVPPEPPVASAERLPRPRRLPKAMRTLVAAAAVLVIAFAGAAVTWAVMQQRMAAERAESEQIAAVLSAADARVALRDADGGGRVTVVFSETHDQAVVVVSDLAGISEERSYQVWLVDETGQTSAGVMPAGETSATMLVSGIGDTEIIGVTEEPAGGSEEPTLPMIADVDLSA